MAGERIGVGVIGCGRVAALRHLPALRELGDARAVAVADVDAARAERLAERFGVPRRYRSHAALLADDAVDAVVVCVPAAHHAEVALAALDAGKHVLLEKPLALDLDDADRLVERAAGAGLQGHVGFNLRHHRLVRRARDQLAAGAVGAPEALLSAYTSAFEYRAAAGAWRFTRLSGGGALVEIASHHYDLWRFLLGDEVEEVTAISRSDGEDDATAVVAGRMRGGTLVASTFSQRSVEAQEVDVYGRGGRLRLSGYRFDGLDVTPAGRSPGNARSRLRAGARLARELPAALGAARRGGGFADTYRREWEHFLAAIRGRAEPECTFEDGRRALEVLLAVLESAGSGRTVAVRDAPRATASVGANP